MPLNNFIRAGLIAAAPLLAATLPVPASAALTGNGSIAEPTGTAQAAASRDDTPSYRQIACHWRGRGHHWGWRHHHHHYWG